MPQPWLFLCEWIDFVTYVEADLDDMLVWIAINFVDLLSELSVRIISELGEVVEL